MAGLASPPPPEVSRMEPPPQKKEEPPAAHLPVREETVNCSPRDRRLPLFWPFTLTGKRGYTRLQKETKVNRVKVRTIARLKEILGQDEVQLPVPRDATVATLMTLMTERWGEDLSTHISEAQASGPLPHVRILVNGQDIAFLDGINTRLADGDEVLLLPLVGGG
jgi:molybdopterin synthase sulfur carrier subunit